MSPEALIGMELGNSVLQRLLGQGTMGTVYLATRADQQVALKVFLPASPLAEAEQEEYLRRLEEIIARNASLDHPHILGILQHGRQKQLVYQITPYIAGVSLETAFARVRSLPFVQIQHYLEQLASALDYAHALGILHGDIKASNILLTPTGDLLLSDFGLASLMIEKNFSSARRPVPGMLNSIAPEYVLSQAVDQRADLYALGAVLYQMVTGMPPFQGDSLGEVAMKHVRNAPQPPIELRADLPPAAEQVILRALAKRPADRYSYAHDLASAFSLALATSQPAPAGNKADQALNMLAELADSSQTTTAPRSAPRSGGLFDPKWRAQASQPVPAVSAQPASAPEDKKNARASTLQLDAGAQFLPADLPVEELPTNPLLARISFSEMNDRAQPSAQTFPPDFAGNNDQAQPAALAFSQAQINFDGSHTQAAATTRTLPPALENIPIVDFSSLASSTGSINGASLLPATYQAGTQEQAQSSPEAVSGTLQLANPAAVGNTDELGKLASQQLPTTTSGLLGISGQIPPSGGGSATGSINFPRPVEIVQMPIPGQPGRLMNGYLPTQPSELVAPAKARRENARMKIVSMILAVIIVAAGCGVFLATRSSRGLASTTPKAHATPNIQASATAQASATMNANIILSDTLSQNTNQWPTGSQGWYTCTFANKAYHIANHDKVKSASVLLPGKTLTGPFTYTLTMEQIKGDQNASNNLFGMMLYATVQNTPGKAQVDKFYAFEILNSPGGQYQFWKYDNSKKTSSPWSQLWSKSFGKEFKQGSGPTHRNTVKIIATGKMFTFLVNGKQVGTWKDHSFSHGSVGMLVNLNGAEVAFSNFLLTYS
jgi:serine/threonine protein kinase